MAFYRAAFVTAAQTAPLARDKVRVPIVALGGEAAQGARIREFVAMVAFDVCGGGVADCGHFVPEERPEAIVREVLAVTGLLDPQPDATPASDASPPNFQPRKDQSR